MRTKKIEPPPGSELKKKNHPCQSRAYAHSGCLRGMCLPHKLENFVFLHLESLNFGEYFWAQI